MIDRLLERVEGAIEDSGQVDGRCECSHHVGGETRVVHLRPQCGARVLGARGLVAPEGDHQEAGHSGEEIHGHISLGQLVGGEGERVEKQAGYKTGTAEEPGFETFGLFCVEEPEHHARQSGVWKVPRGDAPQEIRPLRP